MTQDENEMEHIYQRMSPAEIPWNIESPPEALVELVESGRVEPCRAIDLGCGAGNYAVYLAERGFRLTAVDMAPSAIQMARANAASRGVSCDFRVADLLTEPGQLADTFQFAYDWAVLHHIFPENRKQYVENVHRLLEPAGKYLSVCFSDEDPGFGGPGKFRETPLGTVLYFSSQQELQDLFEPYFDVQEMKTIEVKGKREPHLMNCAFMEKK